MPSCLSSSEILKLFSALVPLFSGSCCENVAVELRAAPLTPFFFIFALLVLLCSIAPFVQATSCTHGYAYMLFIGIGMCLLELVRMATSQMFLPCCS